MIHASLERLDRIKSTSENLEKQIEEVLTCVKNKPLDLKNISFRDLTNETLKNIDIPNKIQIVRSDDDETIQCDPDKIQVVLMNIISNGIDALEKEGKSI